MTDSPTNPATDAEHLDGDAGDIPEFLRRPRAPKPAEEGTPDLDALPDGEGDEAGDDGEPGPGMRGEVGHDGAVGGFRRAGEGNRHDQRGRVWAADEA